MPRNSPVSSPKESQVTLRYSDSCRLVKQQVLWSENGVCLTTKWPFTEGAEIEIGVMCQGKKHRCIGIVVGCEKRRQETGYYQVLVYCLKAPCPKLRAAWDGRAWSKS